MNNHKIKYPIGEQDFVSIREEGKIYVDKTELIYKITNQHKYVFLTRPRRFGKSLLLSTIKTFFEGKREFFKGLKISEFEKDWPSHPVFNLSLARFNPSENNLTEILENQFEKWEQKYDIKRKASSLSLRFGNIIEKAFEITGKKVVCLIDEYDAPLLDIMESEKDYEKNRDLLKSIYTNFKDLDSCLRFVMLTGVSRFSQITVFSGLNNIDDITFDSDYSTICGFTENEIKEYLWEGVKELGAKENLDISDTLSLLKEEYDGYHFGKNLIDVYNPYSLLNCLSKREISNYWFKTGTPKFLAEKIKESSIPVRKIFNSEEDEYSLVTTDTAFNDIGALLFQTGYLTIKKYDNQSGLYILGIPNKEVRDSLFPYLLTIYSQENRTDVLKDLREMRSCLVKGDPDEFLNRLKSFFASVSYRLMSDAPEKYFQNNLYLIVHALGLDVSTEVDTSDGRIDLIIKTNDYIYVIEIKVDKSSVKAVRQIENKEYDLQWKFDKRKVFTIGLNFSSKKRNITDWQIK